jgi:hypothetical protein
MPARFDSRGRFAPYLLVLLGLGFFGYVVWLLDTRVGGGDVYPQYSTLRADPLGCKALYLTIENLPDRKVRRNMHRWNRLRIPEPAVFLAFGGGGNFGYLPRREKSAMLDWMDAGHRVVITFPPDVGLVERSHEGDTDEEEDKPGAEPGAEEPPVPGDEIRPELLEPGLLGLKSKRADFDDTARPIESARFPNGIFRGERSLELPGNGGGWVAEGTVDGKPVIASRRFGQGELIVVADSGFASNEGVWRDRRTEFLLSLIGDAPLVVFDERLLGTVEDPGLMTLVRRLGLHGLILGGAFLLVLLVWQGLCPLVPPDPARDRGTDKNGTTLGRDSVDGLVSLLQRGLAPARLLHDGIARWLHTRKSGPAPSAADIERARQLANTARPGHLAVVYSSLRQLFSTPKHRPNKNHGSH